MLCSDLAPLSRFSLIDMQLHWTTHIITGTILTHTSTITPHVKQHHFSKYPSWGSYSQNGWEDLSLPLYTDLSDHPRVYWLSRHPLWVHLICPDFCDIDVAWIMVSYWSLNGLLRNQSLITDFTMHVPDFDLPHYSWAPQNHFWMEQVSMQPAFTPGANKRIQRKTMTHHWWLLYHQVWWWSDGSAPS